MAVMEAISSLIVTPMPAIKMENRDHEALLRGNNKSDAVHALPIRWRDSANESIELPPSDHERSTTVSREWASIRIGIDCVDDSHGNAAGLGASARMSGQPRWRISDVHGSRVPQ